MTLKSLSLPESYPAFLQEIKTRIHESQIKASLAVNRELVLFYWWMGREIAKRQTQEKWGSRIIEKLCKDLQSDFPGLKGFSRSNVFYMRSFYRSYEIVQEATGQLDSPPDFCLQLPWWHNVILIEKIKDLQEREWYARKVVENGWSQNVLEIWIESDLYHRQGKAPNNFQKALPQAQSDFANQLLKDPYSFDFLTLNNQAKEKELEDGLMNHLQKFLLELGSGFAFVGRQIPLRVGSEDFYLDLLFYHIKLRCYFLIELKAGKFQPADVGQLDFYLAAIDDKFRNPGDHPTIGLILCKSKDHVVVEYALRNKISPIGVANFKTEFVESLPDNLKEALPTIEEIKAETALFAQKAKLLEGNDSFDSGLKKSLTPL